jgi:membrane-bound metal-dependent hydrolase YbcI (DUF457 family)
MTGRSHMVIGTVSAATAAAATRSTATTAAVIITAAVATAKLPDFDMNLRFLGVKHRGVTHTLIFMLLLVAAVGFGLSTNATTAPYVMDAVTGMVIGYGMHLVADACTPHGVPVFAPFYRPDVHLLPEPLRITTGSWQEMLIVAMIAGGALLYTLHTMGAV